MVICGISIVVWLAYHITVLSYWWTISVCHFCCCCVYQSSFYQNPARFCKMQYFCLFLFGIVWTELLYKLHILPATQPTTSKFFKLKVGVIVNFRYLILTNCCIQYILISRKYWWWWHCWCRLCSQCGNWCVTDVRFICCNAKVLTMKMYFFQSWNVVNGTNILAVVTNNIPHVLSQYCLRFAGTFAHSQFLPNVNIFGIRNLLKLSDLMFTSIFS